MDARLQQRLSSPLPLSRFTQTPPDPNKWRRNAEQIERVLPDLQTITARLQVLKRLS
jgi:hypothetical protein